MKSTYEKSVLIHYVDDDEYHVTAHNSNHGCGGGSTCQVNGDPI